MQMTKNKKVKRIVKEIIIIVFCLILHKYIPFYNPHNTLLIRTYNDFVPILMYPTLIITSLIFLGDITGPKKPKNPNKTTFLEKLFMLAVISKMFGGDR